MIHGKIQLATTLLLDLIRLLTIVLYPFNNNNNNNNALLSLSLDNLSKIMHSGLSSRNLK